MPEHSQAGIVSRITRKVASESGSVSGVAVRHKFCRKTPKSMAFGCQTPMFSWRCP